MNDKPQQPIQPGARGSLPPGEASSGARYALEATDRGGRRTGSRAGADEELSVGQVASAVVAGALLSLSLRRRPLGGVVLAIAGSGLIYRGMLGRSLARDVAAVRRLRGRRSVEAGAGLGRTVLERSITIQKPGHELYRAWRVAENLSKVMGHFAEVTTAGPDLQHWMVQGPFGQTFEWDSHVVEEHPGEYLRWESMPGAQLPNEGWVRFRPAPGDWGTVVTLRFRFSPPGGAVGDAALKLLGDVPTTLAHKALQRFKSLVETGEIPTTRPNPAARGGGHAS